MKHKLSYTAALISLGLVSAASAQTRVQITGSTAFRGNFYTAATAAANGIFDAPGATVLPAGANGSSSAIVYTGNIHGAPYVFSCSWSGSEAGIANVAGASTLANPGYPATLPGVSTTFLQNNGTAGAGPSIADLSLADTSQAVSLTPPSVAHLHEYGTLGVVTFTFVKGKNSAPAVGDTSWTDLTTVTEWQMANALQGSVSANYLTGNAADMDPVYIVGRNAGSGTRANVLEAVGLVPTVAQVSQLALNSYYPASGVLTFNVVKTGLPPGPAPGGLVTDAADSAASYPSVANCFLGGVVQPASATLATVPNVIPVGDDGYDSGGFVSDVLSCDGAGVQVVIVGYAGISDATHARDGVAFSATETTPSQPGGAVWLNLDGIPFTDGAVINGNYSFWGHEHLYGQTSPSGAANTAAAAIKLGVLNAGGLGDGTVPAATDSGIKGSVMAADKPGDGDSGYPSTITVGTWGS